MNKDYKWIDTKSIDYIDGCINTAFVGKITDSMYKAAFAVFKPKILTLAIVFYDKPTDLDLKLIEEIKLDVLDCMPHLIEKVEFYPITNLEYDTKLRGFLNIFTKYNPLIDFID